MTENEAIKELETSIDLAKMCTQNFERKREIEAYKTAIQALSEIQAYRAIGTVEELQALKEKAEPKKPRIITNDKSMSECWVCPVCGEIVGLGGYKEKYCCNCGTKFDWS